MLWKSYHEETCFLVGRLQTRIWKPSDAQTAKYLCFRCVILKAVLCRGSMSMASAMDFMISVPKNNNTKTTRFFFFFFFY